MAADPVAAIVACRLAELAKPLGELSTGEVLALAMGIAREAFEVGCHAGVMDCAGHAGIDAIARGVRP